jgi:NAD(P)-dependent dehydrogenase (short-subunit alcohol dehydrogenase family)
MSNKPIALITGASKGIGAATAMLFAENGFDVCINYLSDEDGAKHVARECEALGGQAITLKADISKASEVSEMFRMCDNDLGCLSCLVNNAGIIGHSSLLENLPLEALSQTFQTNVFGAVYCIQEAVKRMSTKHGGSGGTIVNMSSLAAVRGSANEYVHYAASKGAIESLTVGAGKELASSGIRVNAIRVGTTDTTIHAVNGNPDRVDKIAAMTPLGRIAFPVDIAQAALWLASDKSKFVTGTVLTVAGGL